jgi:uncharacterized protein YcbX
MDTMQAHTSSAAPEQVRVGSVVALWRYPVKSMMGEELNASEITDRGFLGDRRFAVVDRSTGKVGGRRIRGSGATSSTSGPRTSSLRRREQRFPQFASRFPMGPS